MCCTSSTHRVQLCTWSFHHHFNLSCHTEQSLICLFLQFSLTFVTIIIRSTFLDSTRRLASRQNCASIYLALSGFIMASTKDVSSHPTLTSGAISIMKENRNLFTIIEADQIHQQPSQPASQGTKRSNDASASSVAPIVQIVVILPDGPDYYKAMLSDGVCLHTEFLFKQTNPNVRQLSANAVIRVKRYMTHHKSGSEQLFITVLDWDLIATGKLILFLIDKCTNYTNFPFVIATFIDNFQYSRPASRT